MFKIQSITLNKIWYEKYLTRKIFNWKAQLIKIERHLTQTNINTKNMAQNETTPYDETTFKHK